VSIAKIIADREIKEVVHFTTNYGCLGTLYTKKLQSRQKLQGDELLEYLFAPNAALRKDQDYLDHVSLSIEHINRHFFSISSGSWHRDEPIFWCILSFNPAILTHPNVEFATTNNIYTGVSRGRDADGLQALYAPKVNLWTGKSTFRGAVTLASYPTCPQAEALYPAAVSTDFLQRIYVCNDSDQSEVVGFTKASFHNDVDVVVAPEMFGARP
jgi:hypothetical protein